MIHDTDQTNLIGNIREFLTSSTATRAMQNHYIYIILLFFLFFYFFYFLYIFIF